MERRTVVGLGAAGLAAASAGFATGQLTASASTGDTQAESAKAVPFYGKHQAGIVTPAQDRLHFAAFDVITDDRDALIELLKDWTVAAARMSRGAFAGDGGAVGGNYEAPPEDTGETQGLPPAKLTVTVGFGPSLFRDSHGKDRFDIADRQPKLLQQLPAFALDDLDDAISDGDLCVQACANDPQVAVHAIRNLARIGFGKVSIRWSQLGFGRTATTSTDQETPRNLLGFKDGTANLKSQESDAVAEHLWVDDGDASWMKNGSYLVTRKIRMMVETWDRAPLSEQEAIFGRSKAQGAPLTGTDEFDEPDFHGTDPDTDKPVIATDAHMRLAHPSQHDGARMLRRGYSYVDGSDDLGRLDCGLFFIAYQADPQRAFISVQETLSTNDSLNEYIKHRSSALFACPAGVADKDDYWGRSLFS